MRKCPVCERPDLATGLTRCPQCNADLECFDLLDALEDKPVDQILTPPKLIAVEELPGTTGSRNGELHGALATSRPGIRKIGLAVGLALVLVPFTAWVSNRNLVERIDRLENRLGSVDGRTVPSPSQWSQLYSAVQTLQTRMQGVAQQLSGFSMQQAKVAAEARRDRSKLEDDLGGMGDRLSRAETQLAALGRRQDAGRKELKEALAKLAASFPPASARGNLTPQPGGQSSPSRPTVTATPAEASTFTDYQAAPTETLWRIARRIYGKGLYYPVLLEDNPALAIHGPIAGRAIRITRRHEHAQETYRRLVFTDGGRTRFRYRAKADDSWRSVARAFYGSERRARELAELNGTQHPQASRRVRIPLD